MRSTYTTDYKEHQINCDVLFIGGAGSISVRTTIGGEAYRLNIEEHVDCYNCRFGSSVGTYDTLKEALDDVMQEIKKRIDNHLTSQAMFATCAIEALDNLGFVRVVNDE